MNSKKLRIFTFIVLFLSITFTPWWMSFFLILVSVGYFSMYIEAIFFAFLLDLTYSPMNQFPYFLVSIAFVGLILSVLIKSRIRK